MSEKTAKIVRDAGLIAVAAGTIAVCVSVGASAGVEQATKIVALTGAAVTAVAAVILAIFGKAKN